MYTILRNLLVIAAVVGLPASVARADLEFGDPIDINGFFDGEAAWGSLFGGAHPFGGESVYFELVFKNQVNVTSFELVPPKGKKFAGRIDIFYVDPFYLFGLLHDETIEISGIKSPDDPENFINSVEVLGPLGDFSTVTTDGFNITFDAFSLDIFEIGLQTVSIYWTQIPAPGTLALLGVAGLMGTRRRRRQ